MSAAGRSTRRPLGRTVVGVALSLVGSAALVGLQVIVYGRSEACERLAIELGLAGATLGSALAQCLLLIGAWLIWSARRSPSMSRRAPASTRELHLP